MANRNHSLAHGSQEQKDFCEQHNLSSAAIKALIRQHYPDFPQDNKAGNPKFKKGEK